MSYTRIYRHTRIANGVYVRHSYGPGEYLLAQCIELIVKGIVYAVIALFIAAFHVLMSLVPGLRNIARSGDAPLAGLPVAPVYRTGSRGVNKKAIPALAGLSLCGLILVPLPGGGDTALAQPPHLVKPQKADPQARQARRKHLHKRKVAVVSADDEPQGMCRLSSPRSTPLSRQQLGFCVQATGRAR